MDEQSHGLGILVVGLTLALVVTLWTYGRTDRELLTCIQLLDPAVSAVPLE